jgi:integrase
MPRRAKPWRRKGAGGAWYAQIGGVKERLAGPEVSFEEADAALHRLLADRGESRPVEERPIGVKELCERFFLWTKDHRKPRTAEFYRERLKPFVAAHGAGPARDIKPHQVLDWANRPEWGRTTRHHAISVVQTAWRWAKKVGHLDANELGSIEKPPLAKRETIPSTKAVEAAIVSAYVPLGRLLDFLHETGARPGEAARITKGDVDFARGVVLLQEHKTDGSSGKPRAIVLSARALAMLRELAEEHPTGPLFRNTRGRPWTRRAMSYGMQVTRAKVGAGREMTCHSMRHRFATDACKTLPNGVVAALLGHATTRMVDSVYSHVGDEHEALRDAVGKVRP